MCVITPLPVRMLCEKYNWCVCGMERGQAVLFGRIKIDFKEDGEYVPGFLKYFEDLREMIKRDISHGKKNGNKRKEGKNGGKGEEIVRQIKEVANASLL